MRHLLARAEKPFLIGCALAALAVTGWTGFAYAALSSRQQVTELRAERDDAATRLRRLEESAGDLGQVEAKLSAARIEYSRTVQGWAEAKAKLGATHQELAALSKRLDQARDRAITQTGSVRPAEPAAKAPARKP